MKSLIVTVTYVFLSIAVTGCATQGVNSYKYNEPIQVKVENETIVDIPYSSVWDRLVKQISKSFYIINNIDKESRIINLTFSTNKPEQYIDCGKTDRTYTQDDKTDKFDYAVAASSDYKSAAAQQPHPSWASYHMIHRRTNLEGRSNIYIAPSDKDNSKTVVTVNTRYIWTVAISGDYFIENVRGSSFHKGPTTGTPPPFTVSFNTSEKGESGGTGDKIYCVSKGTLEKEILGLIGK